LEVVEILAMSFPQRLGEATTGKIQHFCFLRHSAVVVGLGIWHPIPVGVTAVVGAEADMPTDRAEWDSKGIAVGLPVERITGLEGAVD
jgi:hypothetical protein